VALENSGKVSTFTGAVCMTFSSVPLCNAGIASRWRSRLFLVENHPKVPRMYEGGLTTRRRVIYTLVGIGMSGVFVWISLELGLWFSDTSSHRPANDFSTVTWGHPVVNNSAGFREREFAVPKDPDSFRVMVLGDSLTWGAGLAADQRYPALLEEKLRSVSAQREIEVLNFGRSGLSTVDEERVLAEHVRAVQPDLIIVGFCVNDPQQEQEGWAVELEQYEYFFRAFRLLGRLGFHRLAKALSERFDQLLRERGWVPSHLEAMNRAYALDSRAWSQFLSALREIHRMAIDHTGRRPIFITLLQGTADYNVSGPYVDYLLRWTRQAAEAAQTIGYRTVETETAFKREGYRSRNVAPWDGHPDAQCNQVYADALYPIVLSDTSR
jgi:lysophospholipase L1-like esterase